METKSNSFKSTVIDQFSNSSIDHLKNNANVAGNSIKSNVKAKRLWFNKDEVQNVSAIESLIRAVLVIFLPIISVCLDWFLGLHSMYFLSPLIVYFAVTAMTRNCPVKTFFTRLTGRNTIQ